MIFSRATIFQTDHDYIGAIMRLFVSLILLSNIALFAQSQSHTKVILLGTGTPNADPNRFGASTAIVVDGVPYIIDCGPGVVRRATAAGIDEKLLRTLFITHLHSDHTAGLSDFLLTPAVLERPGPVTLIGPKGSLRMTNNILDAYQEDIAVRTLGPERGDSLAYRVEVKEITEGEIYSDERIQVTAFRVNHGTWPESFGYRFVTPDKTIVLSGDCTYSESVVKACNGCDILIHEVYSEDGFTRKPEKWKQYHAKFHSSATQVARVALQSHPKLLILNHALIWDSTESKLLGEIRTHYKGKVVLGKDLEVFD